MRLLITAIPSIFKALQLAKPVHITHHQHQRQQNKEIASRLGHHRHEYTSQLASPFNMRHSSHSSSNHHHQLNQYPNVKAILSVVSLVLCLNVIIIIISSNAQETPPTDRRISTSNQIALNLRGSLLRLRRQSSSSSGKTGGNAGANSGSSSSPDNNNSGSPDSSGDEKPPEEVLSSLKCDFGTSDAPDLCKFKILDHDQNNPLAKSLVSWTLGSGRSALFQGGPLIDASEGNDTSGGYIFYETSNPFVAAPSNLVHAANSTPNHHANEHSSASSMPSARQTIRNSNNNNNNHLQHEQSIDVTSGRFSVGAPNSLAGPTFMTPNLTAPGPAGMCLSFRYAIQGLSADELRIYVADQRTGGSRQIWASSESAASNWTKGEVLYSTNNKHALMFTATTASTSSSSTSGGGSASGPAQAAALKDLQQRQRFRGYLALDELEVQRHDPLGDGEACRGHCNFDGDLCGWTNAENGLEDNFDWTFGRGSENLFTGPARDFTSSTNNNELTGSYLFTDSGYPRRPGDRAVLISPVFPATAVNEAMCMRLAVHMFGNGIGSLAIKIRYTDEEPISARPDQAGPGAPAGGGQASGSSGQPAAGAGAGDQTAAQGIRPGAGASGGANSRGSSPSAAASAVSSGGSDASGGGKSNDLVIWEMSGDAGNSWHQAQTSVSSSKSSYQVLIEGVVGENHLGNMAIDEISLSPGPCPTSPPVASKNYGDCTFEQSMCYWRNPDADIHLDDLDWIRSADEQTIHGPNFDHTLKKRSGSYLKLENTFREPKSGTRAFLLSPIFQPKASGSVQCLSFYYYMFMRSISSSGPNLGTIRVYLASNNELVPIWRLTNPISSPSWKHGRASLATALVDGQPVAPTKLFQIAFEGIWGDAAGGAIALDDITVFDGACDIMPAEARSVPGECTFDVDICSWSNKTYDQSTSGVDSTSDSNRSPFLQSVNNAPGGNRLMSGLGGGGGGGGSSSSSRNRMSWQLATVDSRPVNLQDHTYKAPIGYTYIDVLDSGASVAAGAGQQMAFPLQSAEVTVQSGQQVATCLSFWFAAYGRQDNNQLNVYLTQASAPPAPPQSDDGGAAGGPSPTRNQPSSSTGGGSAAQPQSGAAGATGIETDGQNSDAWKMIDGKLVWSSSLKNITETSRRKWIYGQVTLRADSNYIVRFVAISNDGGFALDDISYFEGACETRPAYAKVTNPDDDEASNQPATANKPAAAAAAA